MSLRIESSASVFKNKLSYLEQSIHNHNLVTNQLEIIEKNTFYWKVISLLNIVGSLFGYDLYSYVRVNHVAKALFNYCKINKKYLDQALISKINSNILNILNSRTSNKYSLSLDEISSNLDTLIPPKFSKKLNWPTDLKKIGLNKQSKKKLEAIFSQALPLISSRENTYILTKEKQHPPQSSIRKLTIKKDGVVIKKYSLPITVAFLKKDDLFHIILMGKKILGKGGERGKVRLCYDLTKGSYLARKKVTKSVEKRLIKDLQQHPQRGLVAFFGTRKSLEPTHKEQILEYHYDASLTAFIKKPLPLEQRMPLIQDLLYGLNALHDIRMKNIFHRGICIPLVSGFHHDIKPDNILVRNHPVTKKLEAAITDFGFACNPGTVGGTAGFRAPEEVTYEQLHRPIVPGGALQALPQKTIEHNANYGQAIDIWAMGLVLVTLVLGRASTKLLDNSGDPPIACIEDCLLQGMKSKDWWTQLRPDAGVANLQQTVLDKDLNALKKESLKSLKGIKATQLTRIWDELIFNMLKVKPEERLSAKTALQVFNSINYL